MKGVICVLSSCVFSFEAGLYKTLHRMLSTSASSQSREKFKPARKNCLFFQLNLISPSINYFTVLSLCLQPKAQRPLVTLSDAKPAINPPTRRQSSFSVLDVYLCPTVPVIASRRIGRPTSNCASHVPEISRFMRSKTEPGYSNDP